MTISLHGKKPLTDEDRLCLEQTKPPLLLVDLSQCNQPATMVHEIELLTTIQAANNRYMAIVTNPTKTNKTYFSKLNMNVDLLHFHWACTNNNMLITTCSEINVFLKQSDSNSSLSSRIKEGMCNYNKNNNAVQNGEYGISIVFEEPTATKIDSDLPTCNIQHKFYDDATGKPLIRNLVLKARAEELDEVRRCNIYTKVPTSECYSKTGRAPRVLIKYNEDSGEYLLGTCHGIAKARSFKGKALDSDRWSYDELKEMKATQWEPYPGDSLTYRSLRSKVTF